MHYPPDEWKIEADEKFSLARAEQSSSNLAVQVLVQVDHKASINSCFKAVFSGAEPIKLDVPAERILIMGGVAAYRNLDSIEKNFFPLTFLPG